jgi:hypothetical protein
MSNLVRAGFRRQQFLLKIRSGETRFEQKAC